MKILHVTNRKGGVGNPTIALHAAWYFAEKRRVLFIDLDDQRNSSRVMQDHASDIVTSTLLAERVQVPGLDAPGIVAITADDGVKNFAMDASVGIPNLRNNVIAASSGFDICILDAGPSASALNVGPLLFATHAVSPIELATFSLEGVTALLQSVIGMKREYNPNLEFLGLLPNKYVANQPDQKVALNEIFEKLGKSRVFEGVICQRQAYARIGRTREPVWLDPATASRDAGREIRGVMKTIEDRIWKGAEA